MAGRFRITDYLGDVDPDQFMSEYRALQAEIMAKIEKLSPERLADAKLSGTIPMHILPFEERIPFIEKWRKLVQFDTLMYKIAGTGGDRNSQIDAIFDQLIDVKGRAEENPFLRFPAAYQAGDSPLEWVYSNINVGFDEKIRPVRSGLLNPEAGGLGSHFGPGVRSFPLMPMTGDLAMPSALKPGSKFMVYDIETASLRQDIPREVAYTTGVYNGLGDVTTNADKPLLSRPRAFARGSLNFGDGVNPPRPHSIEEFLEGKYGLKLSELETGNVSNEFAERMVPWLNKVKESDHLIGHNISGFDNPYIFRALSMTEAYKSADQSLIPGFKNLVDEVHSSLPAKVIDTLHLARMTPNLVDLGVASELRGIGKFGTFSIENILLETDLAERIGVDKILADMGDKGLHFGEVDVRITFGLLEHLKDLKPKRLGGPLRRKIIESSALTPFTNIRMQGDIADPVLQQIVGLEDAVKTRNVQLNNLLAQARTGDIKARDEAIRLIRSDKIDDLAFNLNPIEHQTLGTRTLGLGVPQNIPTSIDPDKYIFSAGTFDREVYDRFDPNRDFSRGILDQKRISDIQMGKIQGKLAQAGMPWAGLSYEERSLGTVLSHLTSSLAINSNMAEVNKLAVDTLTSRFEQFDPMKVAYQSYSGRPSLPAQLLVEAGLMGGDKPALLTLSSVEPTRKTANTYVNLVYNFEDGEAVKLVEKLKEAAKNPNDFEVARMLGIDVESFSETAPEILDPVKRFRSTITDGLDAAGEVKPDSFLATILEGKTGVSVGQLTPGTSESVIEALKNFTGLDDLSDRSALKFGLPFARIKDGFVETSGAILTRHLTQDNKDAIGKEVAFGTKVYDSIRGLTASDKTHQFRAAKTYSQIAGDKTAEGMRSAYEAYQTLRPKIPKALGISALAGVGLIAYNYHKQSKEYAPTIDQMPYETGQQRYTSADLLQMSMDSGVNKSYQRYDPLKTAFVVNNLSEGAINHTAMNWDRNNNLYGGVL